MGARNADVVEQVPASRKLGADTAAELLAQADALIVAKGRKVTEQALSGADREAAVAAMLGPTGNLRAPTLKVGRTIVVGFDEAAYARLLDG